MPPKGKGEQPKTAKVAVDKSFGMKNKKGGAAQRAIKQLNASSSANMSAEAKKKQALKDQKEVEKLAAEQARKEAAELFKPVQVQKVPFGVDPKTVLCQFFKKGACDKGKKCKFSHDLAIERKVEKRNLYADTREGEENGAGEGGAGGGAPGNSKEKDLIDDWDEEMLRKVIMSKHGNPKTTTDKVCKFFIEAVEEGKYGWFWTCPNGGDKCMYRHSLPPGFVLKTKEQRAAEKALHDKSPLATLTLEDFLESERHKLTGTLTPVTPETFAKWKKDRMDKKQAEEEARAAKEATGRAMFEKGDWQRDSDEESSEDEDDSAGAWNLEALRRETENARVRKEEERLAALSGGAVMPVDTSSGPGPGVSSAEGSSSGGS